MDCRRTRHLLEMHALGALTPGQDDEITAHLAACESCRSVARDYATLTARIAESPRADTSALAETVKAAARRQIRRRRTRSITWRVAAAVSAAAAAIAVVVVLQGRRPEPVRQQAQSPPSASRPLAAAPVTSKRAGAALVRPERTAPRRWELAHKSLGHLAAGTGRVFTLIRPSEGKLALVALDGRDGRILWAYTQVSPATREAPADPVVLDETRVCWTHQRRVHLLDARTGRLLWQRDLQHDRLSSPAVDGENLFVASDTDVFRLDAGSGRTLDRWPLARHPSIAPRRVLLSVRDGWAYIARRSVRSAQVACLDLATRKTVWTRAEGDVYQVLAGPEGVFLRSRGSVALLDAGGRRVWARGADGCGLLTRGEQTLFLVVSADRGKLLALNPRTGRDVWTAPSVPSCDGFVRAGGHAYLRSNEGDIYTVAMHRP